MKIEKREHFYNEIKVICNEIGRINLPSKFIKAAKNQKDDSKLIQLFEEFKGENPELWKRMATFYSVYSKIRRPQIFYGEFTEKGKDDGLFKYDPKEIDPVNLCFLFILGNGAIDDDDVFTNYIDFVVEIEKVEPKFGSFIEDSYLNSLSALRNLFN